MTQNTPSPQPTIVRAFVLPALWIFLIPVLSLAFFWHAQDTLNKRFRESLLESVTKDVTLDKEEREQAIAFYTQVPASRLVTVPELDQMFTEEGKRTFFQFRWLIRIAAGSIAISVLAFIGVGLCVLLSMKSQRIQYYSLLWSWYLLRLVGIAQTVAQGLLLFALSYWVPALWLQVFSVKLTFIAGAMAVVGVFLVLKAFFKRVRNEIEISGLRIDVPVAKRLWQRLNSICATIGTPPPDNLLVGIDTNFFVSEQPILANGKRIQGRTLFVSLPLLKQLSGSEADAVLAHEMAHFAGQDTLYSRKITPLLTRYGNYLEALHAGGVTYPVYLFMNCFRAMFELSIGKLNREREFRADEIATQLTSPRDLAGALLRTIAYAKYRDKVQEEFFQEQAVLEEAAICDRIEEGFVDYARSFAETTNLEELSVTHPFDSHPSSHSRLDKVGFRLQPAEVASILSHPGDGAWYHEIDRSSEIERAQWDEFEEQFRVMHEQSLPYRFLPSTDEEREIVVKAFPLVQFTEKAGALTIDHEKLSHDKWETPIYFRDIQSCQNNEGVLTIQYFLETKKKQTIKFSAFKKEAAAAAAAFQNYYGRHLLAVEYQKSRSAAEQTKSV
jgi:Zn-dependent protease with chaperone function